MATADIPIEWLRRARTIALDLPETVEKETWEHPTFRVRDKIFASIGVGEGATAFVPGSDDDEADHAPITTMTMKAAPGEQESLLAHGLPFFKPKYVGNNGWIGVVIGHETDWTEIEELVIDSYLVIAPKKLARQLLDSVDS